MSKIKEIILEPSKIYAGSNFLLKIKAIRYATYQELKQKKTYLTVQDYSYSNLKGE